MNERKVLVAEDDKLSIIVIRDALSEAGFQAVSKFNGKQALEEYEKNPFRVVIVDINMPVMSGQELIDHLAKFDPEPIIIVTTAVTEPAKIIDIMSKGVSDYLIKPIDIDELVFKVKKAFEMAELKRIKMIMQKEKMIKFDRQLEWFKYKEKIEGEGKFDGEKPLFKSLSTSFSQGSGLGTLLSLMSMMMGVADQKDDHYLIKIKPEFYEMVKAHLGMADQAIDTFRELDLIISQPMEMEKISCASMYNFLGTIKEETNKYAELKSQSVLLSDLKSEFGDSSVCISKKYFNKAFREVLLNAYKYSIEKSRIVIMMEIYSGNVQISVLNLPSLSEEVQGIPVEYELVVFEPFFRISSFVQEEYETLDFGLGLTVVEKIIEKHNGYVSVSTVTDHSEISAEPQQKVIFSINIPVVKEE